MSIKRQYSLPNCTLTLFGWSESSDANVLEVQPLMSVLANVECQIAGVTLTGGKEFFESLVWAVSYYAQEVFSGVHYPFEQIPGPKRIRLEKRGERSHRLSIQIPAEPPINPPEITLTDVQLFDLVEAIDQFFADHQTLPDLSWSLQPTSRRYVQSAVPLAQRATPAAVGVAGVAVAAGLLFMVPIPNIERPNTIEEVKPSSSSSEPEGIPSPSSGAGDPQSSRSPNPASGGESALAVSESTTVKPGSATPQRSPLQTEELEALIERAPSITDPTQIGILNRRLHEEIDRAWQNRDALNDDLTYRVAVAEDGAILGYKASGDRMSPQDAQLTPLLELAYIPTTEGGAESEAIAEFKVVFRQKGVVEVSPWNGFPPENQSLVPEITDPFLLENLNQELYTQINEARIKQIDYPVQLNYRVAVKRNGEIADYEALNQGAFDYLDRTPLPSLFQLSQHNRSEDQTISEEPLAQFKVVFTPNGVLQVSPWRGYSP